MNAALTKYIGTVTYWNCDRGFGFIQRADDQGSIFCHIGDVDEAFDELTRGQRVEFEITESKRKPGCNQAVNVSVPK